MCSSAGNEQLELIIHELIAGARFEVGAASLVRCCRTSNLPWHCLNHVCIGLCGALALVEMNFTWWLGLWSLHPLSLIQLDVLSMRWQEVLSLSRLLSLGVCTGSQVKHSYTFVFFALCPISKSVMAVISIIRTGTLNSCLLASLNNPPVCRQ